jgi:hypothetical protein
MRDSERDADFESMIDALATTGRMLRLSDRQPGLSGAATRKIIELAKAGERVAERLTADALDRLRH